MPRMIEVDNSDACQCKLFMINCVTKGIENENHQKIE